MLVLNNPRPYVLDINKLRSDKNVPYTSGLFVELARQKQYSNVLKLGKGNFPIFCLDSEFDIMYHANNSNPEMYYYSLRRLYLAEEDPNEYDFAKNIFGSWDHWLKLQSNTTILEAINKWRDELQTLLTSKGCKSLISKAIDGDVNASKFIATRRWQDVYERVKSKREEFTEAHEVQADYERLKLVSSN
jgi:hypothetical protein